MYRRPKFLELVIDIRLEMAREADYDVDLFTEIVRSGRQGKSAHSHSLSEQSSLNGWDESAESPERIVRRRRRA